MPLNRDHLGLLFLIFSVPVQYLLVEHMSGTSAPLRNRVTSHFVKSFSSLEGIQDTLLSLVTPKFIHDLLHRSAWLNDWELDSECPALEVLHFRESTYIHFGLSTTIHSYRPPDVLYRVGQIVKSKSRPYKGVIIGWDVVTSAPEYWISQNYPREKPHWLSQPSYRVLVDSSADITYEPQENLEVLHQSTISNSAVKDYFSEFDGSQYIPLPWLKHIYPRD